MAANTPSTPSTKPTRKKKDRAAEVANTFEWLITAFILAFVFRAFVMEAFRIPTGSMADTLMGAHFQLRCRQCGYPYEFGFMPEWYHLAQDTLPPGRIPLTLQTRCPSCGYRSPTDESCLVANGDRILVLKCIYQFTDPKRWDVVVFKNPKTPTENYIKRLVALPGEQVEIIDGDVYINGLISRKPPAVQKALWMPVEDFDYQPVNPNQLQAFNGNFWRPPFDFDASSWRISSDNPTRIVLDGSADQMSTLTYGGPSANGFEAGGSYNPVNMILSGECSDLMMRFYVKPEEALGTVGITLSKYGVDYRASCDLATGQMTIARVTGNGEKELGSKTIEVPKTGTFALMKFANVDHQLLFEFDGNLLRVDLGRSPTALEYSRRPPQAQIFGAGKLTLAHIAIFRDEYYTEPNGSRTRARQGEPFQLQKDEFFMLGDNSPNSEDSRWWQQPTEATKGTEPPRAGVVPRYYLVGKAMFVYWPSGFEFPWPETLKNSFARAVQANPRNLPARILNGIVSLRWIPNVGRMRFIYGGTGYPRKPAPPSDVDR